MISVHPAIHITRQSIKLLLTFWWDYSLVRLICFHHSWDKLLAWNQNNNDFTTWVLILPQEDVYSSLSAFSYLYQRLYIASMNLTVLLLQVSLLVTPDSKLHNYTAVWYSTGPMTQSDTQMWVWHRVRTWLKLELDIKDFPKFLTRLQASNHEVKQMQSFLMALLII